jgi:hypothetical protein
MPMEPSNKTMIDARTGHSHATIMAITSIVPTKTVKSVLSIWRRITLADAPISAA